MSQSTNISLRMDSSLKKQADELFSALGLNMTTAVMLFLRKAVTTQGIPFSISRGPNAETLAAMEEAERISRDPSVRGYHSVEALFEDLDA